MINFIFYSSSASAIDQLLAEGESESNQSQKNSDMLTATFNAEIEGIVTKRNVLTPLVLIDVVAVELVESL